MILDSSAVVAVLLKEPGYDGLLATLRSAPRLAMGAPTLLESGVVLSARLGEDARSLLSRFLLEGNIAVVPWTEAHFGAALGAWLRFGRGRHPAQLNFGDCLAYATASLADEPLLFVGDDFGHTDITPAR